jgi:hypothetical protein
VTAPHPGAPIPPWMAAGPKPEPRPRPHDIRFSVVAWLLTIGFATASTAVGIWEALHSDEWRKAVESAMSAEKMPIGTGQNYADYQITWLVLGYLMLFGVFVTALVLVGLFWRGHGWPRFLLQLGAAMVLAQGLLSLFGQSNGWVAIPMLLAAVCAIGAVVTANSSESVEYLRGPR